MIDVLRYKLLNIFNNNNWYDRVYLCYEKIEDEKPNTYFSIVGFNCYKFINTIKIIVQRHIIILDLIWINTFLKGRWNYAKKKT